MNTLLKTILLCALVLWTSTSEAAQTVTGQLRYVRNWTGGFNSPGSLAPASSNGADLPAVDVKVSFQAHPGCSGQATTWTDASGNYSATFANSGTCTYQLTAIWQGRNLDTPGDLDSRGYRIVSGTGTQFALNTFVKDFAVTGNGTFSAGTKTFNSGVGQRYANAHAAMQFAVARMRALSFPLMDNVAAGLDFEKAVARIRGWTDTDPNSSCAINSGDAPCFNFDTLPVDNSTAWHEMGHALAFALRQGFVPVRNNWSYTGWGAVTCTGPTGQSQDTGVAQVSEVIANFLALNVAYDVANYPADLRQFTGFSAGGLTADQTYGACACEYPTAGTVPMVPACGMSSILRSESRTLKAAMDLVDAVTGGTGCQTETVQLPIYHFMAVINSMPSGSGEGQVGEAITAGAYFGNAIRAEDQSSILDVLRAINLSNPAILTDNALHQIWRNACFMHGDTDTGWTP